MTQLMYMNPAMINPKTKENVREAEMTRLKGLKEQGFTIIGLEMTVPPLAELCDRNIDPQHTEGKADQSCTKEVAEKAPELLGWFKGQDLDKIIFVTADENVRLERVMKRDNCNKDYAQKKILAQAPEKEKIKKSDFIIENNSTFENLKNQVKTMLQTF